jgi:mRNA-degrading endonuclease RelE of RelBE toxin-antitoxin system
MSYKIKTIPKFDKELKRLVKKYPSLKAEFIELVVALKQNPLLGTSIGNHCYKIRLSIASKGTGKSGGARLITYLQVSESVVYLLSIYDKSEEDSISDKELIELLKWIPES